MPLGLERRCKYYIYEIVIINGKMKNFEILVFYSFLHLKSHFGHQKWTSQKWCLEVHTTFFKEVRAKKRLPIVWRAKNDVFLAKINNFCWNFKHFLEIQGRQIWWFWMKTNGYNMWWFWRFFYQKHVFSSKNIVFCIGNSLIKLRFIEDLNA